eukprot:44027-Hanusia_phi.AAC.1
MEQNYAALVKGREEEEGEVLPLTAGGRRQAAAAEDAGDEGHQDALLFPPSLRRGRGDACGWT